MRGSRAAFAAIIMAGTLGRAAFAEPVAAPRTVSVDLPICHPEPFDYASFVGQLEIELAQDGVGRVVERAVALRP